MAAHSYSVSFISRDSRLQFRSLNHSNPDAFNTQPAFPRLPDNRTYGGHRESDAIDPKLTRTALPSSKRRSCACCSNWL